MVGGESTRTTTSRRRLGGDRRAGSQRGSGKTLAQRGIDNPIEAPQLCSRIVKILDQLYLSCDGSSSEPGSDVVLAINDDSSTDVSKIFLNVAMDKLDTSLTDDQKLSVLEIAGSIKSGSLKMMSVEFEAVYNEFCTEHMSDESHGTLLLAGENTYKQEYKIFDNGASQNVEQDRFNFIVYFELKVPIPMKQGEGVLYATGMGIVIYNFRRDDQSVYSEPGFALHTHTRKRMLDAGMSIVYY